MIEAPTLLRCCALSVAQVSDAGGRQSNEDALGSAQRGDLACYVVSDGAGGHEGGEIASAIVVRSVMADFECAAAGGAPLSEALLRSCIAHAAAEVARRKEGDSRLEAMSATVAVVLVDTKRGQAAWAHLGDTRVYLFRDGRLLHATRDHSLAQQIIDAGLGQEYDARTHPKRNLLYAAIGAEGDVPPEIQSPVALQDGDALLVCTDGLWEWVTEDVMESSLAGATGPQAWLDALCAVAAECSAASAKTRDNFTAQVVWIREDGASDAARATSSVQHEQGKP